MTPDRRSIRGGDHFEVSTAWLEALTPADRERLRELGHVRFRGPVQSVIQARQHRVGRWAIGGSTFVLEHALALPLVVAMAVYSDHGLLGSFDEASTHEAQMDRREETICDLLALLLCREARRIAARQIYGCFETHTSREEVIRGRVDWSRSFGAPKAAGIVCEYHNRTSDVLENQVILAALKRLGTWRLDSTVARRLVAEQEHVWTTICSDIPITSDSFALLTRRRNRMNAHYRTALSVARLVLDSVRDLAEGFGEDELQSLWLDVPNVFERFVAELLRRAAAEIGMTTEIQRTNRSALVDALGSPYRSIRPDLVFIRDGKAVAVVDMKAKPRYATSTTTGEPLERISTGDIFQLLFYAREAGRSASSRVPAFIVAPTLEESCRISPKNLEVHWRSPELGSAASLVLCPLDVKGVLRLLKKGELASRVVSSELPALARVLKMDSIHRVVAPASVDLGATMTR